jgi:YD repeat-containing protein
VAVKSENGSSLVSRVSFTYDGLSRKKSETQQIPGVSVTATVSYGYDSDGNLAKLTYPDGNVIDYTYTARNQLWQVQNGGPPVATYAYDLAGRLTNLDRENGVNTVLTYGNNAGELTAVDHAKGANYVDGVLYSLNAGNGRREGITRSGGWNDVMIFHHTQCCCL